MSEEQDRKFFRNYSLIIGLLAVMIVIFLFLARHFGVDEEAEARQRAPMVAEATQPVGQVNTDAAAAAAAPAAPAADTAASTAAAPVDDHPGAKVYNGLCFSCHGTGVPGSPQLGDKAAWETRLAKGIETLHANAINGLTTDTGFMPPKGGNPALSDDEVKSAVDYMVSKAQ
jgi:cytochrome c5